MKIALRDIPRAGLDIERSFTANDLGFEPGQEATVVGAVDVSARVERAEDAVIIKADVDGTFKRVCARCLVEYTDERAEAFDIIVEVEEATEEVDLADEIRQELILALSPTPLCRDDCKGLCPKCGANLNSEKCKCQGAVTRY